MFSNHITKELSAYCHGELAPEKSRRVAEHLIKCDRCRNEYEHIKTGIHLAEQLPHVSAPESLWGEIETLLDAQKPASAPAKSVWFALPAWRPRFAAAAIALLLTAGVAIWVYVRSTEASWPVTTITGAVKVGSDYIGESGRLAVGDWLVTGKDAQARIGVGLIGQVEVDPNSRVRLIEARLTENRLELAHGRLRARISAPPRIFFVNTPAAEAIDLGCAYTLEVDNKGNGLLHVTSGKVALVREGRESFVLAGAMCRMNQQVGPGTPYFEDANDKLRHALERFDFEGGGDEAFQSVLTEARVRDTYTLWNLLPRVDAAGRGEVFDRIVALTRLPSGITKEGVMRIDKDMLELWKDELYLYWY